MGKVVVYISREGGGDILNKLKWNSKWIVVAFSAIILLAVALSFCVGIYRIYRLPDSNVEITGAIIDNCYNNYISEFDSINDTGDLVRIGDKLYYNYYGSYASYGLYEISSNGTQRILWDGYGPWAFLTGHGIKLYPIQAYNGKLLMNTIVDGSYYVYSKAIKGWELAHGRIQTYCEEAQTFEETMLFGGTTQVYALTYQETPFGFAYESSERFDLWVYTEEGGSERISEKDVCAFYSVGEQIYYLTRTTANDPFVLRVFDWGKKTDVVICEWAEYTSISYFIIEEDVLIFVAVHPEKNTQSVYKLNLQNPEEKEELLYTIDRNNSDPEYIYSWNVWNRTVYLCTQKGLIACDLDTGTYRVLCDKKTLECDIVDDIWVYFLESDSHSLWRVRQSGGDAELVLG